MSVLEAQAKSTKLHVTYDGVQHCTALEGTVGKVVATDVPRSCGGKEEEFSPIELVGAGLGLACCCRWEPWPCETNWTYLAQLWM